MDVNEQNYTVTQVPMSGNSHFRKTGNRYSEKDIIRNDYYKKRPNFIVENIRRWHRLAR